MNGKKLLPWIAAGAFPATLAARFILLLQRPFLPGADAYYYALQIRAFAETGTLKIPDSGLVLPLMGWTARLGWSVETVCLFWVIFIQALCALSLWAGRRLTSEPAERHGAGTIALCAWILVSPTLSLTCIEFPKYAFALAFIPLWGVALHKPKLWPVSVVAVLLSCAGHRTMVGVAGVLLGAAALWWVIRSIGSKNRYRILAWVAAIGGGVTLALLFGGRYFSMADLQRLDLRGLQPGLVTFIALTEIPWLLKAEAVLAAAAMIVVIVRLLRRKLWTGSGLWAAFLPLVLVPLGSVEVMGLAERLVLALPFAAVTLLSGMKRAKPEGPRYPAWLARAGAAAAMVAVAGTAIFGGSYGALVHPERLNPDYALYDQVTRELAGRDIPMLIAHRGLNFFYKYRTGREAFHYEPEDHWPKDRTWRLAWGVSASELAYYLPDDSLWESGRILLLSGPYTLIREDTWEEFRRKVDACGDDELRERVCRTWMNPWEKRPAYLYAKHASEEDEGPFGAFPAQESPDPGP